MKKIINKNTVFSFIIGGLIFGSIGIYGANNYKSDGIEYSPTDTSWKVSNVNQAINSLYSMKTELDNIKSIGDATAAQILSGKTAAIKGNLVIGSMTNNGAVTSILNAGGSYTIPAGYHNGSGKVTVNTLASQTEATATAADITSGKTAWVNGTKITGTKATGGNISSSISYSAVETDIVYLTQTITYNIANMGYTKAKISMSGSSTYSSSASTNKGTIASTAWGGSGVNGTYDITGATSLTLSTYSNHNKSKNQIPTISVSFS